MPYIAEYLFAWDWGIISASLEFPDTWMIKKARKKEPYIYFIVGCEK